MTDHAEVRERLELAAVEPGGLDRLAAGDTPDAALIAGHLAGCPSCSDEARRLARLSPLVRDAALTFPPDDLRERTLSLVREVGRPRAGASAAAASVATVGVAAPESATDSWTAAPASRAARRRTVRWPAAIAAVVAFALLVGGGVFALGAAQRLQAESAALAELNTATLRVSALPDATRVDLVDAKGAQESSQGTLLFSPATAELVISAPSLTQPSAGQRYACWITRPDGSRARMGDMEFGGGLAYWTGWDDKLHDAGPGTKFGVTLVGADGRPVDGDTLVGMVDRG